MYGAILGDIIGSPFEFDRGDKTKEFDLFTKGCDFTDDSVMTIAVGEALLAVGPEATVQEIEEAVVTNMQDWGKRYPYAGYGGRFRYWLRERNPKPYGSYGNGSAMRVSAAGWLYDSLERTREVARATANVTHNHPEGIKGAEATASAIYMARNESSKEEIKEYIRQGEEEGVNNKYLPASRVPWYSIEQKKPAPIWVSSACRDKIKFVRNLLGIKTLTTFHSVYVRKEYEEYTDLIFCYFLTPIAQTILKENRKKLGNGLEKFQPNDLNSALMLDVTLISSEDCEKIMSIYHSLATTITDTELNILNDIFLKYLSNC